MPYTVAKQGGSYVVKRKDTGKVVAGNKTKLSKQRAIKVLGARASHEPK